MKIFITGVNGFIGSNLAKHLLREGHQVSGLVRETSDLSFIQDLGIDLIRGDLADFQLLCYAFSKMDPVFHVAALASDWGPMSVFKKVNVEGTRTVLQAAEKAKIKRLVYVSSTAVYGFGGYRFRQETDIKQNTRFPYCITKREAEELVNEFALQTGLAVTIIQPGNVFGPCDRTFFIKFARALEKGLLAYVKGGRAWTCPTYVENLVKALYLAAIKEAAIGETFIITDGIRITWREFTEKIAAHLQVPKPKFSINFYVAYILAYLIEKIYLLLRISHSPMITRYRISNAGRDYHFSIDKAQRLLGFEPPIALDEALERTVRWYRTYTKQNQYPIGTVSHGPGLPN